MPDLSETSKQLISVRGVVVKRDFRFDDGNNTPVPDVCFVLEMRVGGGGGGDRHMHVLSSGLQILRDFVPI